MCDGRYLYKISCLRMIKDSTPIYLDTFTCNSMSVYKQSDNNFDKYSLFFFLVSVYTHLFRWLVSHYKQSDNHFDK